MKTDISFSKDKKELQEHLNNFDYVIIINQNMFYDLISEKWILIIAYYE